MRDKQDQQESSYHPVFGRRRRSETADGSVDGERSWKRSAAIPLVLAGTGAIAAAYVAVAEPNCRDNTSNQPTHCSSSRIGSSFGGSNHRLPFQSGVLRGGFGQTGATIFGGG